MSPHKIASSNWSLAAVGQEASKRKRADDRRQHYSTGAPRSVPSCSAPYFAPCRSGRTSSSLGDGRGCVYGREMKVRQRSRRPCRGWTSRRGVVQYEAVAGVRGGRWADRSSGSSAAARLGGRLYLTGTDVHYDGAEASKVRWRCGRRSLTARALRHGNKNIRPRAGCPTRPSAGSTSSIAVGGRADRAVPRLAAADLEPVVGAWSGCRARIDGARVRSQEPQRRRRNKQDRRRRRTRSGRRACVWHRGRWARMTTHWQTAIYRQTRARGTAQSDRGLKSRELLHRTSRR